MNGTGGISLGSSTTVAGTLTLTSGNITLGSNQLTVSTISGGGANSYIKTNSTGTLKQNISNAGVSKNFPVGNSAYNPVTITNNTNSADDFSVSVGDGVFANGSTSGSAITNGRVNRTWDISKTSGNSGTGVTLNFLWNSGEVEGTLTDPRLYHYVSSAWNQESGTPSFDLSTRTLTYTNYTGSFSPFYLGEKGSALPVTFTSLTGTIRNGKTNLNWTIADEHNVDRYEVEESANGRQFQSFAQVDAASRSSYQAIDAQLHTGANYYRVKAVDIDGKLTYSKIIRLDNNSAVDNDIRIYPNPSRGEINLGLNIPAGNYQIRLINAVGQTVYQQPLTHEGGSRSLPVSLPKLSQGIYQMEVRGGVVNHVKSVRIE